MTFRLPLAALMLWLACAATTAFAQAGKGKADDWLVSKTPPEKQAPPRMISAAESDTPAPGPPGMPETRNERKKPPSPEYLVGKVVWGQAATIGDESVQDWNLAARDCEQLLAGGKLLGLPFHWGPVKLADFDFDPARLPALLISGVRPLRFSPQQVERLREYVLEGGMIVIDSVYGSPYFEESAVALCDELLPQSRLRPLPADHPLYHMEVDVEKVQYACGPTDQRPRLEGVYVGSRVGVLLSRQGLGCGWHGDLAVFPELKKRGLSPQAYAVQSAKDIGLNLAAYIVGYGPAGQIEGEPELFGLIDQKDPTAEFVFTQLVHGGAWNVHPNASRNLLLRLKAKSAIPVNVKRVPVDLEKDDPPEAPFLFLSGLDDFSLSPEARAKLRGFLDAGGLLVVNNGLGLATFQRAFERELGELLPGARLAPLPADHPVFSALVPIRGVEYTPALAATAGAELGGRPLLLGVESDGELKVIFSPYDMEGGWNDCDYPLSKGYEPASAFALGMNIITYAMTR